VSLFLAAQRLGTGLRDTARMDRTEGGGGCGGDAEVPGLA